MKSLRICLLLSVLTSVSVSALVDGFPNVSTLEIVEKTLSCTDCADWQLEGICHWLDCGWTGCSVKSSLKVSHYIPDMVVAAYTTSSAWAETRFLTDTPPAAMVQSNNKSFENTPVDFKFVDVFSNPTLAVWNEVLNEADFFCRSALPSVPLPLFLSDTDPAWRSPRIERLYPQALIGLPKIKTHNHLPGLLEGYWAPEYPRCAWGAHPYDAINAAVAAHRATHIVTRKNQPHVYSTVIMKRQCGKGVKCWPPDPVSADNDKDNRFQMLYPVHQTDAKAFGGAATWANGKSNQYETYLWTLWRHYTCCKDRGRFIDDTEF